MAQQHMVPILLRPDCLVHLWLPADMTRAEAERISRVVMAYVDEAGVFSAPEPTWENYAAAMTGAVQ